MSRSPAKRHTSSASSQWYFTKAEILSSPSVREGLNPQEEKTNRSKGCLFMEVVGQKLRLHLYTVSTACMFFHRFYMRQAMKLFHHYEVAATCLFLATKVEENPRKLPDLIVAAIRYSQKNWELEIDDQSKEYWRWRDKILYTEEHLLEALCFDLEVAHPYPLLVDLVKRVTPGNSALGQCAWAFVNDSHRTVMQILYPPEVIAAAAFYFAKKFTKTTVPASSDGKEWWETYGVKLDDLRDAIMIMVDLYNMLPDPKTKGKYTPSLVSPHDPDRQVHQENGATGNGNEMHDVRMEKNGSRSEEGEIRSPVHVSSSTVQSPRYARQSSSPIRERSPRRPLIDSYRPGDDSRPPPPPRRNSQTHLHPHHYNSSRYTPPGRDRRRERDTYIPPSRKRSLEDSSPPGRDKKRRTPEGEISEEGEIRS